jgi:hypothetical protein
MPKTLKVYVAGKVSKDSVFRTHYWRDEFRSKLQKLSGMKLVNLDPTKTEADHNNPAQVFGKDAALIKEADVLIAYLTDDISVGCSQEILIAKYFSKPVIALAPHGGKFNGASREYFGKLIHNYKDPFVFTTCDVVCSDIVEVAKAIKTLDKITPKKIDIIKDLAELHGTT